MHVDSVVTVLPIARLPTGGKHPVVSVHCELQPRGDETRKHRAIASARYLITFLMLVCECL